MILEHTAYFQLMLCKNGSGEVDINCTENVVFCLACYVTAFSVSKACQNFIVSLPNGCLACILSKIYII